jgi:hypothetical protein
LPRNRFALKYINEDKKRQQNPCLVELCVLYGASTEVLQPLVNIVDTNLLGKESFEKDRIPPKHNSQFKLHASLCNAAQHITMKLTNKYIILYIYSLGKEIKAFLSDITD